MLEGCFRIDPSTASSACRLCGGWVRSRSSVSASPASYSRSVSSGSTATWPLFSLASSAADGAHFDGHGRGHGAMQTRGDRIGAHLTHRISNVEVAPVDRGTGLLLDSRGDVGGCDRAIEPPLRTRFGFDHDRLGFELLLQGFCRLLFFSGMACRHRLQLSNLLQRASGGCNSQSARDEVVARIAIGHVLDLAGFGDIRDVLLEQNLHAWMIPDWRN